MMTREEREALWSERIGSQAASGLSGRAWCAREGVSYWSFHQWRRRLGEASSGAGSPSFVRVFPDAMTASVVQFWVGAARIEVSSGFDAVLLRQVVATLSDL